MPSAPDDQERWVTVAEFAREARMAPKTVYNRRSRGDDMPPATRVGNRVLMHRADVERFFDRHAEHRDRTQQP